MASNAQTTTSRDQSTTSEASFLDTLRAGADTTVKSVEQFAQRFAALFSGVRRNEEFVKLGDRGDKVLELQKELKEAGINVKLNGVFDKEMEDAVKQFQRTHKLTDHNGNQVDLVADGVIGPRTMRALDIARGREVMAVDEFAKLINYRWSEADGEVEGLSRDQEEQDRRWKPAASNSTEWAQLASSKAITAEAASQLSVNENMARLARESEKVSRRSTSLRLCLGYVNDAMENAGLGVQRMPWAIQGPQAMRNDNRFLEVTGMTADKIASLPPGSIVFYEKPGHGYSYPGHAQIKGLDGKWHSDFTHDDIVYAGEPKLVWAFIPKA
jgi:hypothetical protein